MTKKEHEAILRETRSELRRLKKHHIDLKLNYELQNKALVDCYMALDKIALGAENAEQLANKVITDYKIRLIYNEGAN